jgi:hypothetical protein
MSNSRASSGVVDHLIVGRFCEAPSESLGRLAYTPYNPVSAGTKIANASFGKAALLPERRLLLISRRTRLARRSLALPERGGKALTIAMFA